MRPELNAKRKIEALERRRALIDTLIEFVRTHPESASDGRLHALANRTGLRYDYAVVRPIWEKDRVVLRLEKYLENWYQLHPYDYVWMTIMPSRIVRHDVSASPDRGTDGDIGRSTSGTYCQKTSRKKTKTSFKLLSR